MTCAGHSTGTGLTRQSLADASTQCAVQELRARMTCIQQCGAWRENTHMHAAEGASAAWRGWWAQAQARRTWQGLGKEDGVTDTRSGLPRVACRGSAGRWACRPAQAGGHKGRIERNGIERAHASGLTTMLTCRASAGTAGRGERLTCCAAAGMTRGRLGFARSSAQSQAVRNARASM